MAELVCGTADRDEWLAARREGITATDIPVIMGLVSWDSPFALYWRKKGMLPEVEQSDRMRLGSWLESKIIEHWDNRVGDEIVGGHGGLWRSSARSWQLATPDRVLYELGSDYQSPDAVLECKTSSTRDGWGEDGTGSVPAHVRAQVLWQMDTLGVATGHVAVVFLPSGEFRSYTITHDVTGPHVHDEAGLSLECSACSDIYAMRKAGWEFWDRLRGSIPPPVDGSPHTTDALRHLNAGVIKGKRAEISVAAEWQNACDDLKVMQESKRELENLIREQMGDAALATDTEGRMVARREVFKRAGYEVPPGEVDRLVRVKPKETSE